MDRQKTSPISYKTKRIFDLVAAFSFLLILAVPLIIVALLVRIFLGSPILFTQERAGLDGRPFLLYKFRTMKELRNSSGELLPDEKRLSSFGHLLRASSLDELPELINIIKGEMSFIGPRPLLLEYLPLYSKEEFRRHEVLPGLTGWAQINGRNTLSWDQRFKLDIWYVDNWNLLLDLKILIFTFAAVLKFKGVSAEGHVTMQKFTGSADQIKN
ncbi:MAG: sugar transferase [bacterium]|nr:sugar transferase [bacterium]